MKQKIDINCDMGESFGDKIVGCDEKLFPYITSCNIACGEHGGDPKWMLSTVTQAIKYDLNIGAHPSYPDREGFGRREIKISDKALMVSLNNQILRLRKIVQDQNAKLSYVKPHGALYNVAAKDKKTALLIIKTIKETDSSLALLGLAGSEMEKVAKQENLTFISEAFADRRYTKEGFLAKRANPNALIDNPKDAVSQVFSLIQNQQIISIEGKKVSIQAKSICIHGDTTIAYEIAKGIDELLKNNNISKESFSNL